MSPTAPPSLRSAELAPRAVDAALAAWGGFALETHEVELPWRAALAAAHELWALPRVLKQELAIERSPHFRGWSEMHNERDWREQLHLGRDLPAAGGQPAYLRLEGPNLWPAEAAWRRAIGGYMDAAAGLGERLLEQVAAALGLAGAPFAGVGRDGYLVMKLIGYHPQAASSSAAPRPGVAPHVDFSWLTLTLQDSPGLEVRARGGGWWLIEPRPGTLWVHAGELLQLATRGRYQAAPHRVINQSTARTRVSIPLFLNPPLAADVPVFTAPPAAPGSASAPVPPAGADGQNGGEHVHHVLPPDAPVVSFHFGRAEWRRKGLGGWCARCAPPPADT